MKQKILLAFFILAFCFMKAHAANGTLDSTFGDNGFIMMDPGNSDDYLNALAIQPDGKILSGGTSIKGSTYRDMIIVRHKHDGRPDSTFGTDGIVRADVDTRGDGVYSMAVQPDGKIVVAGYGEDKSETFSSLVLLRLHPDGSTDESFGTKGKVIADFAKPVWASGRDIAILPGGKILVAGEMYVNAERGGDFMLWRFDEDGSIDSTFDNDGIATVDFDGGNDYCFAMELQPDGKIIVAGSKNSETDSAACAMARFGADGSLDETFGEGGRVIWKGNLARDLMVVEGGKITVLGQETNNMLHRDLTLKRFNYDGTPDASFGKGVSVQSGYVRAVGLSRLSDGRYIAAASAPVGQSVRFMLACYTSEGVLDKAFGKNGKRVDTLTQYREYMWCMAPQADGRVVAGGYCTGPADDQFLLVRYNTLAGSGTSVADEQGASLSAYPNPAGESLTLEYTVSTAGPLSIMLSDISGGTKILKEEKYVLPGIYSQIVSLPSGLPAGTYFLIIDMPGNKLTAKVIR